MYENANDDEQQYIQNLALFLTGFLGVHLKVTKATRISHSFIHIQGRFIDIHFLAIITIYQLVENPQNREVLLVAHQYLLKISQVEEREIFKICLEYWAKLVAELYEEIQQLPVMELPLLNLGAGMMQSASGNVSLRKSFYTEILARLRVVMIERMVKPEEVRRKLATLSRMIMWPVVTFSFVFETIPKMALIS